MPGLFRKVHGLKLVEIINFECRNAVIVAIDGTLNKSSAVVSLEAPDYALILWLNMSSEVGLKVLNADVLEVRWDNVAGEVILKEQDLSPNCMELTVSLLNPLLIELCRHPCLCVVAVIESKLSA